MARAIDAERLSNELKAYRQQYFGYGWHNEYAVLGQCLSLIDAQPTLTPQNEWVSVEEKLPDEELKRLKELFPGENEVEVLVMIQGAYTATTLYWDGEKFYDEMSSYEVAHWMPLPAPSDRRPPVGEGNA